MNAFNCSRGARVESVVADAQPISTSSNAFLITSTSTKNRICVDTNFRRRPFTSLLLHCLPEMLMSFLRLRQFLQRPLDSRSIVIVALNQSRLLPFETRQLLLHVLVLRLSEENLLIDRFDSFHERLRAIVEHVFAFLHVQNILLETVQFEIVRTDPIFFLLDH